MNINQFIELLGKKKQTIISLVVIFLAVAIVFSALQPFKYDSNMKLLVIIGFKPDVDPYTASRSNQYLSGLLANIVSSGSFFEQIKLAGFKINDNYFSGNAKQQMKKWRQTISAKSMTDTGAITLDVYHPDRAQAEEIVRAVAYTLQTTNPQYHGFGNSVEIKTIDQPTTSNYPVEPNLPINLSLAVIFALVFSFCYIYLWPEEKYNLRLWPKKSSYTEASPYAKATGDKTEDKSAYAEATEDKRGSVDISVNKTNDESAFAKATEDKSAFAKTMADKPVFAELETDEPALAEAVEDKIEGEPAFVSLIPERAEDDFIETPSRAEAAENNSRNISTSYNPADYQSNGIMDNVFKR